MPITPGSISSNINLQFLRNKIVGRNAIDLANAIGAATFAFLSTPNLVTCTVNGTVGPLGSILSPPPVGIVPATMSGYMNAEAAKRRMTGKFLSKIFDSAATGLSISLSGMTLTGSTIGVAMGLGVGFFTAASTTVMSGILLSQAVLRFLKGRNNIDLASCIAFGLVTQLQTATKFSVTVTGVVAPVPPVGPLAAFSIPSVFTKIS